MLASQSVISVMKLILSPVASGINPKMVVMAVRSTGRKRAAPPKTMASLASNLGNI